MGIVASFKKEAIGRAYRNFTKDELTLMIYGICKNIVAKWCYPFKNPNEVSQKEINNFLDITDFNIKQIRTTYPDLKKTYDIPYDIYLRGIYRYAEKLETELGTNMDKVLFEKVIQKLYGDNASCINHLNISKKNGENMFVFNKNIVTNLKDENIKVLANTILSIYSKCRFGAIIVSSYSEGAGHRTLIFIENINDVLNIFYYDPHGSNKLSWSNKENIYSKLYDLFTINIKPYISTYKIKDLVFNKYETICLFGLQAYSSKYDIGMCQIFASLWLYCVVKVITESTKNKVQLPSTSEWLYLIDDYFISQFNDKQRYNVILLFVAKLFNFYIRNNPNYLSELESYNKYLLNTQKISEFEVPYETKPKEDIKESEEYILKVAREGILAARKQEKEEEEEQKRGFISTSLLPTKRSSSKILKRNSKQGGFIASSLLPEQKSKAIKRKSQEEEEKIENTYEQYSKKIKTQEKKEEEYLKSLKSRIPFIRKKKLFDECLYDSDCISSCCYWNDIDKVRYCNEADSCPK